MSPTIENLARLLGIAVGQQLHRALEIGEQHGDLFALALEGAGAGSRAGGGDTSSNPHEPEWRWSGRWDELSP
jgi:hypothetical protein